MSETAIKAAIQRYLASAGYFSWRAAASQFGRAGISDIIAVKDGRIICLEVKTPEAYRRPNHNATLAQLAFLERIRENGGIAAVVCSVNQVGELLQHLELPN